MRMRILREGVPIENDCRTIDKGALIWNDGPLPVLVRIADWRLIVGSMTDLRREGDYSITAEVDLLCDPGSLKPEVNMHDVEWSGLINGGPAWTLTYGKITDMDLGYGAAWSDLGVIE